MFTAGALQVGGLALLVFGLASIPGYVVLETWMGLQATKADWQISGEPVLRWSGRRRTCSARSR
jgi:hypothetical protein